MIERVLELRRTLKRCVEVVWHHRTQEDRIRISMSSVRRIMKRHYYFLCSQETGSTRYFAVSTSRRAWRVSPNR